MGRSILFIGILFGPALSSSLAFTEAVVSDVPIKLPPNTRFQGHVL